MPDDTTQPAAVACDDAGKAGANTHACATPLPIATTPPPLPAGAATAPAPDPAGANILLDQMRGLNIETIEAIPPEFEDEEEEAEPAPRPADQGPAGQITYVERPEDSELIVELVLDDQVSIFDPAMTVYQVDDEKVIIPLGKFAEAVGFPIRVDTSRGIAEGWFLTPENTFRLSSPYSFVEIAGKKIPFDQLGIAETHIDDIYVSQDLLTSWFPIGLTLSYNELRLYMKTLKDLPVQEREKRHDRWETSKFGQKQPGLDYDPKDVIKLPHRMLAAPALGITHTLGHSTTSTDKRTAYGTSVNATADLLGMDARFSAGFSGSTRSREEIQSIQFTLSKEDYDGVLLGPLKATRFELGDVSSVSIPLAGSGSGRGFTLTNQPYNFVSDASNFRISGFGPAGWDVEVFQAEEILAFSTVTPDGRFEFETLPLREGFNLFKIILYGPHGERETRYDRYYLGQNMVPQGAFYYNASALQSLTPLLDVSINPADKTPPMVSLVGEYGINDNLSVSAGIFHGEIAQTMMDGVSLGVRGGGNSTYAQLNTFMEKSGGLSADALITGNITETLRYNLRHEQHLNYATGIRPVSRSNTVQVSQLFTFKNEIMPDLSASLQLGHDKAESGRESLSQNVRLAANFFGINISNSLERTSFSDATPETYNGALTMRARTPIGLLHSDFSYIFHPKLDVTTGNVSLQTNLTDRVSLTNSIRHTFGDDPVTRYGSSLGWKLDKVNLSLSGEMDNKRNRQLVASVNYNLIPQALYGDYAFSDISDNIANGRLIIRPFIDTNGDGIYNDGEPLVEGVVFRNALRGTTSSATKDGTVILGGLTPNLANRITVEIKSLTDIFMVPRKKELIVLGKSGMNGPVDFAFTKLGTVSGTLVTVTATGEEIPLNEVQIILLDKAGKQVADTYSESDGYFSFDSIPVSSYELFFPASETLRHYYTGSGEGPRFKLDFDNPELIDIKLKVEPNRIVLENPSAEAPAEPAAEAAPAPAAVPVPEVMPAPEPPPADNMPIQLK